MWLVPLLLACPTAARATGIPGPLLLATYEAMATEALWLFLVLVAVLVRPHRTGALARATFALACTVLPVAVVLPGFLLPGDSDWELIGIGFILMLYACPVAAVYLWRTRFFDRSARLAELGRWRWSAANAVALVVGIVVALRTPFLGFAVVCLGPLLAAAAVMDALRRR